MPSIARAEEDCKRDAADIDNQIEHYTGTVKGRAQFANTNDVCSLTSLSIRACW